MNEITRVLSQIEHGDPSAAEQLLPLVYDELRKLASQKLNREKPGQTLQATALVHEAYVRLLDKKDTQSWNSRGHFFAAAAEAMRRILVDNARRKRRVKRGGDLVRKDFNDGEIVAPDVKHDLIALDEALDSLSVEEPVKSELVKLRFFAGLTIEQAANALGISTSTADRHWAYARAWLYRRIANSESVPEK